MADFTANDRFIMLAILLCAIALVLVLTYVRKRLMRNLLLIVFGMSGFAFVLVPMYNVMCQAIGLNGKLDLSNAVAIAGKVDKTRTITVEFVVAHNQQMPWNFKPKHTQLRIHPGELISTAYYAKNLSDHTMVAQAIPSIAPARASQYLKKVECFCFNKQKLGPGESAHLGLRFYLDPDLPADVQRVTLAYTLFDVSDQSKELLCQNKVPTMSLA